MRMVMMMMMALIRILIGMMSDVVVVITKIISGIDWVVGGSCWVRNNISVVVGCNLLINNHKKNQKNKPIPLAV